MQPVVDIIARIRQVERDGSRSDRRLAGVVLADADFASRASIVDLAARADISEPTVTRFCRTVGCDGIRDFKFRLAQALAVGGAYLRPRAAQPAAGRGVADTICDGAVAAIEAIRGQADPTALAAASEKLAEARAILAFGSGGSSSIAAIELQHRLFRLGLAVTAHTDGELQRMTASVAGPGTVVVAFSMSGYAQGVLDAVSIARQYGAETIVVTAPGSALARGGALVLPFAIVEDEALLFRPSPARYALLGLVDMLAMATAERLGPAVLEGLRRIKQSLNTLKINDPHLPIGD